MLKLHIQSWMKIWTAPLVKEWLMVYVDHALQSHLTWKMVNIRKYGKVPSIAVEKIVYIPYRPCEKDTGFTDLSADEEHLAMMV